MMSDGISFGEKHSFRNFGLVIASRNIGIPEKRSIKVTIPYMHGAYDFSALNGFPSYDERKITYAFDVIGATVVEMEQEKAAVMAWLLTAENVDIFDDAYPDTHFHGSYDSATWDEDDSQGLLTVVFSVYPFRLANEPSVLEFIAEEETKNAVNEGVPVNAKLITTQGATATAGGGVYKFGKGKFDLPVLIPHGESAITIKQTDAMTYAQNTRTVNGVSFTVNEDERKVVASGAATSTAWIYLRLQDINGNLDAGKYRLSGAPIGGSLYTYGLTAKLVLKDGKDYSYRDYGGGVTFTVDENVVGVSIGIFIADGYNANGLTFNPRLCGITEIVWEQEVL